MFNILAYVPSRRAYTVSLHNEILVQAQMEVHELVRKLLSWYDVNEYFLRCGIRKHCTIVDQLNYTGYRYELLCFGHH